MRGGRAGLGLVAAGLLGLAAAPGANAQGSFPPSGVQAFEREGAGWLSIALPNGLGGQSPAKAAAPNPPKPLAVCGEVLLEFPEPSPSFDFWAFYPEEASRIYKSGSGLPLVPALCINGKLVRHAVLALVMEHRGQIYDIAFLELDMLQKYTVQTAPAVRLASFAAIPSAWKRCEVAWAAQASWPENRVEDLPTWAKPAPFMGRTTEPLPAADLAYFSPLRVILYQARWPDREEERRSGRRRGRAPGYLGELRERDPEAARQMAALLGVDLEGSLRETEEVDEIFRRIGQRAYRTIFAREEDLAETRRFIFPDAREFVFRPEAPAGVRWSMPDVIQCFGDTWLAPEGGSGRFRYDFADWGHGEFVLRHAMENSGLLAPSAVLWEVPYCLREPGTVFVFREQEWTPGTPLQPWDGSWGSFYMLRAPRAIPVMTGRWHVYAFDAFAGDVRYVGFLTVSSTGSLLDPEDDLCR